MAEQHLEHDGTAVLPLTQIIPIHLVRWLLQRYDFSSDEKERRSEILLAQLRSKRFTPIYWLIYEQYVRDFPVSFTCEMIEMLSLPHIRFLDMTRTHNVCNQDSSRKIWRKVLIRCQKVKSLILDELSIHTGFDPVKKDIQTHLNGDLVTHLSLQGTAHIYREDIQDMIRGFPNLGMINMAMSEGVNDLVFYFSEDQKLGPNRPNTTGRPLPGRKLYDVDLNRCDALTNVAVRFLCQLCGDNLKSLNIAGTEINCNALWYLAGYSSATSWKPSELPEAETFSSREKDRQTNRDIEKELSDLMKKYSKIRKEEGELEMALYRRPRYTKDRRAPSVRALRRIYGNAWEEHSSSSSESSRSSSSDEDEPLPPRTTAKSQDTSKRSDNNPLTTTQSQDESQGSDSNALTTTQSQDESQWSDSNALTTTQSRDESQGSDSKALTTSIEEAMPGVKRLFQPCLINLDFGKLKFSEATFPLCLQEFFEGNQKMQKIMMGHKHIRDHLVKIMGQHASEIRYFNLFECPEITSDSMEFVLKNAPKIAHFDISGCLQVDDRGVKPLFGWGEDSLLGIMKMDETRISDDTLLEIAKNIGHKLEELSVKTCPEISDRGLHHVVVRCPCLTALHIKNTRMKERTVLAITQTLSNLKQLSLANVYCMGDELVLSIADRLKKIETLDISYNPTISEQGVRYVLAGCPHMYKLNIMGMHITEKPFLPMIPHFATWEVCRNKIMARRKEKSYFRPRSAPREDLYDENHLPQRCLSYAPRLRYLDMTHCDPADLKLLAEVAAVCQGGIGIVDYKGKYVDSRLF